MTDKLKVGFVLDSSLDPMDGVQQYVLRTAEWLIAEGHEVHYLVGETRERKLPNVHSLCRNIKVTFNGNKTTVPLWVSKKKVRTLLAEQQFDVLHVQTPHHPFMAQRIIRAAGPKTAVVSTFHILPYNWLAKLATKLLGYTLRPSFKRIDSMFAVSSAAAKFEKWAFGMDAVICPNVFDYGLFAVAGGFDRYKDEVKTILFFGRLVERKGCRYLLEAVTQLDVQQLPPFRVVVCGKGELMSELQQFTHDNKLSNVEFTGFVTEDDKPKYYASADISVFPSVGGESFGIVLLEAMASGKAAVLAGDNPGYATVMDPRQDVLFAPSDNGQLAAKLTKLLTDDAARAEIAKWGAEHAAAYDVKVVGPRLVHLYHEAIAKRMQNSDNY